MALKGTMSVCLQSIVGIQLWRAPTGDVTVDDYREILMTLGQALNRVEVDWGDQQVRDAVNNMKAFINDFKLKFALMNDNDDFGDLVAETDMVLDRIDAIMKHNREAWMKQNYTPPKPVFKRGRKR